MALVAQRVNDYITKRRPKAFCDGCIKTAMDMNSHAHAAQITGALGTTSDFSRESGTCSTCGEIRTVISAV